ncbi:acyl-CoA dehydrogenase [bacterium]|nr:acyl-CoA dehydrogenase [bacterium]
MSDSNENNSNFDASKSFVRDLATGLISEDVIFPYPKMKPEEADMVRSVKDTVDQWFESKRAEFPKWDVAGHLPDSIVQEMRELGLFSLIIPEQFGGLGLSTSAYSRIIQAMSHYDGSATITAGAHSSIGMKGLVMFGNDEQKAKYLPKLATGEMIAAYCLTEAGAGSDAASIKTKAVKDGDDWILNGEKLWITNGGIADFFTVFATTDTPEGKITAFIVTRDLAGVSNGPHEDKMGLRASSTTTVRFDDVRVPAANVLGEVGKGFKIAVKILNNGRTGLGGGSVGGMKEMIALATKQAKMRKQFDTPIAEFGLIKEKIGQMVVDTYASESVVNMVSGLIDKGYEDFAVEAAISKVFATDCLWRTVDEALQVAGGNGYMREFPYERILRDVRINRIFEGTNDILQLFIGLTAMNTASGLLKNVAKVLGNITSGKLFNDPIKGFGYLGDYSKRWVASTTGIGSATMTKVHPELVACQKVIETHARVTGALTDKLLRKHGKEIIHKQLATKRMAQIFIDLYVLSCVTSRVTQSIEEKGVEEAAREIEIAKTFAFQADERIRRNIQRMDENEDESIKSLAVYACEQEKYVWDNI